MSASDPLAGGTVQRKAYHARIERIFNHTHDTRSLFLRILDCDRFGFTPGQFISLALPLEGETRLRPYSIASSPEDGQPIEICFNLVPGGLGSRYLFGLKEGDELTFTGPFGRFVLDAPPVVETIFIAETTAIAPIRPMIRKALAKADHPQLHLMYAAPSEGDLLYRDEIEHWAMEDRYLSFEPIIAPPLRESGRRGPLFDKIERRYVEGDDSRSRSFFICGIGQGVLDLRDLLRGAGYERRAVKYERW